MKQKSFNFKIAVLLSLSVFIVISCTKGGNSTERSPKFQQYYVQGQVLYSIYCSNCHQESGKGLRRLYPPVDVSDYIDNNRDQVICLVKYGTKTPLTVNGVEYNMPMKGNPQLTDLEVAEIVTYLMNSWSREKGIVEVNQVAEVLANCSNK